jgi:ABC-type cobalamin/Fe3+-siderophores transport system ATPase subunit
MEALTVEKLTFYYGTSCVLDEVSFSVSGGLICGLLGPNGSGKTTLLKCINGIYKPAIQLANPAAASDFLGKVDNVTAFLQ